MTLTLWKKSHDKPIQHIKKQIFANKSLYSQSYGFSSSQIQMWELDHKECWAPKNWYFQTVLKKTLDSLLVCKETKPVNSKGNQPWIFIGRTDAEAPILWPPGASSVQSLSLVRLFVTPWAMACQASLSITNSQSLLKLMSIELVMPSNHLILCRLLLLLPSIFPSIRIFSNESALRIRWPKYWSFNFNISPSSEYSGPDAKSLVIGKDPMLGKIEDKRRAAEDEMVR